MLGFNLRLQSFASQFKNNFKSISLNGPAAISASTSAAIARGFASEIQSAPITTNAENDETTTHNITTSVPLGYSGTVQAWLRDFKTNMPRSIVNIDKTVFDTQIRVDILHRVVCYERDAKRQGTHNTRGISDVRGTTRKWAIQKGRGKARVGTHRAPHWRGGGIAHGPKPRSHVTQIQKKVWLMGLRSALSSKFAQDQLILVDNLNLDSYKTRDLFSILRGNRWINEENERSSGRVLFLPALKTVEEQPETQDMYKNLLMAQRNIPGVGLMNVEDTEVYEILKHEYLVLDKLALDYLQRKLCVE
ncbi:54S ribosomal protein yml6, mitochondrial [Mycoemilia scoparia]|uniref:Large ribosomal subunit protein uL4m n=1 Tax=Mycoemilia scoparia TaxID=417184 RepID=A0A9W7ZVJ9_9FUNG|nr:54S ribosomal protein yml6, mitochondrial [Mycoemilia scoparia]